MYTSKDTISPQRTFLLQQLSYRGYRTYLLYCAQRWGQKDSDFFGLGPKLCFTIFIERQRGIYILIFINISPVAHLKIAIE